MRKRLIGGIAIALIGCVSRANSPPVSASPISASATSPGGAIAPGLDRITQADLRRDMFVMASDSMRGREAGSLDELRAAGWVADRAREAGLQPAGDDGTFFQWWPMRRTRLSDDSRIRVGDHDLRLWRDVLVQGTLSTNLDVPIVFVSDATPEAIGKLDLHGKAVAFEAPALRTPPPPLYTIRNNTLTAVTATLRPFTQAIAQSGAIAAIIVMNASPQFDTAFTWNAAVTQRGTYAIDSAGGPAGAFAGPTGGTAANGRGAAPPAAAAATPGRGRGAPVTTLWLRHDMLEAVRATGVTIEADIHRETFYAPSVNVIGVMRGTDPTMANEYVLFSGHTDHDGVRYTVDGDSIWNGADDNASVSVALLASARAFAKHPAKRPILFIWHGAEERGLLGSRWFVNHPTVPHSQIIAVLNGDMIGRNNPDSAALLGAQPPHRNSVALADAALRANAEITHFKLDTIWDRPTHPEGWYFRSDHLPYARVGIPALMFSTLLHPDYHTPRDQAERIDFAKLAKMTQWMYATGWIVANAAQRPDVVPGFKLER